jgi:hypothetical protein
MYSTKKIMQKEMRTTTSKSMIVGRQLDSIDHQAVLFSAQG